MDVCFEPIAPNKLGLVIEYSDLIESLNFSLFSYSKSVIHLDSQIAYGALEFSMSKQELAGA